ncbi:MAG TPA: hypothetical protein VMS65_17070, partial [Polyangiaceae bacterium]|nr:hypothetical protein [Polyangiaceae bacterium]
MRTERLWLRIVGLALAVGLVAAACGGTGFSGDGGDSGASAGEGGTAGTTGGTAGTAAVGGTGGGGTTLCTDASQCDDGKACTLDICNELGVCENPPKCGVDEPFCCAGVCGQCCTATDCADASDCTADDCFAGFCSHTPTECPNPTTQYCSETGCKDREQCSNAAGCDDQQPCTTDRCVDGLCAHDSCAMGLSCCAGGCAECCSDSQCKGDDDALCQPAVCRNGGCTTDALCPASGTQCCERTNGTADCGSSECCTTDDCPNRLCMRKLCTPTGCEYDAIAGDCGPGMRCEPDVGCVPTGECVTAEDCAPPADLCQERRCSNGKCEYVSGCHNGTTCCPGIGCRECCSNAECSSGGSATAK